jgi:hypothetical protein
MFTLLFFSLSYSFLSPSINECRLDFLCQTSLSCIFSQYRHKMHLRSKFSMMLAFEIPAICFSIIIFAYFALNRTVRAKVQNHGWFVLLVVNFIQLVIDLPMPMSYYYLDKIFPASNAYCVWWTWCEFSLNTIGLFLMAWISVERHILIFHSHAIFQVRLKKWMYHFVPIAICLIWTPLFYFVIIVISPYCTTEWDFDVVICGVPCYYIEKSVGQFNVVFNIAIPLLVILIANVVLIIRVSYEKISRHQTINWRSHRKMIFQLWTISSVYLAFWLPLMMTKFIQITFIPSFMIDHLDTIIFVVYFVPLFLPMVCLSILPGLVKKLIKCIQKPKLNRIGVTLRIVGERQAAPNITNR